MMAYFGLILKNGNNIMIVSQSQSIKMTLYFHILNRDYSFQMIQMLKL